jgi:hypothetical protein
VLFGVAGVLIRCAPDPSQAQDDVKICSGLARTHFAAAKKLAGTKKSAGRLPAECLDES